MTDDTMNPTDTAGTAGAAADAAADDPKGPAPSGLEALQRERDDLHDRLLRKTAEFDNFRKRVERDRKDMAEWAAADVLVEILSVMDDFERALRAGASADARAYREGVELIHRQLADLLKKRGVRPIEALGTDFDPHCHQAVAYEEVAGAREGEVVGLLAEGYKLGDRLLRPAMVKVAKAS